MVLAVIIGAVVGALSVIPFRFAMKGVRKTDPTKSTNMLGWFALAIALSFVILFAGLIVCRLVAHDVLIGFAAAEILVFVIVVIVMGLASNKRNKKQ